MPIFLPNNQKTTRQESNFCWAYAFLTVLEFHLEDNPYPKNVQLGIEGFKEAQKEWMHFAQNSASLTVEVKRSEIEDEDNSQENKTIEGETLEISMDQVVDPIYLKYLERADFLQNHHPVDLLNVDHDFYPYLLGFQMLPFNFKNLTVQQIEKCLLNYGPLVLLGSFYQGVNYEIAKMPEILQAIDGEKIIKYRTAVVVAKDYLDIGPHYAWDSFNRYCQIQKWTFCSLLHRPK